jgi:DNA-binding FadR family transcriptional regulator
MPLKFTLKPCKPVVHKHKNIFAGIENRNPAGAFDAMQQHTTHVIDFLEQRQGCAGGFSDALQGR